MQSARPYQVIDVGECASTHQASRNGRSLARNQPGQAKVPAAVSTRDLDRAVRAGIARLTGGLAPSALAGASFDWAVHLAASPGKQLELVEQAVSGAVESLGLVTHCAFGAALDPCRCALPQDNRFRAAEWQRFPFNIYAHTFLSIERWWEVATTGFAVSAVNTRTLSHSQPASYWIPPRLPTSCGATRLCLRVPSRAAGRISCAVS